MVLKMLCNNFTKNLILLKSKMCYYMEVLNYLNKKSLNFTYLNIYVKKQIIF